ncbi:MAG: dTDP-4-dehydrorhamnose 3,5-epimerase [Candidatus Thioglobus sp.]|jgi:dTDP-4-dehydrorhamnose 3,5-epimerase|uniref:dTDP-4-dehydrorhamnose 3,5-epimerase n=1 Tax=marine metagenome TaxID=408172 RepID=A0A381S029_9ZZZZ|nr:dTDP-4-dehydrorhamnose 3,5-epimerase [uncultured Pseudoalteromonas sp.]MAM18095.1 dTDP-4-dehydrorhamnose 3,5-epimerase [Christiangramia sp.]MCS5589791.1 dTDP-4-dehydrorhamnose 3,5-epimerase [Candidatus Thioglobus sp.]MDP6103370.1 dTDP-4-dehydrorhamnose 3,5-epimerase [Gammaproteobacteria bacterium]|tara:strand:+ start:1119 stop:1721 length:603 start_codon:yes stop_codon:yes gene_type:complete
MNIITTNLPGVIVIEPKVYVDKRGFFLETFREDVLLQAGINAHFVQDNHTRSSQGVLRGLHYQMTQTQGKLVRVAAGSVFDVVVDVRSGSPTFGQWYGTELNEDNIKMIYVPPGFAHGFVVLSETADFIYKCTDYYHPESEQGIAWDDPDLNIDWSIAEIAEKISLSDKDKQNVKLKDQPAEKLPAYKDFMTEVEMRAES